MSMTAKVYDSIPSVHPALVAAKYATEKTGITPKFRIRFSSLLSRYRAAWVDVEENLINDYMLGVEDSMRELISASMCGLNEAEKDSWLTAFIDCVAEREDR